VLSLGRIRQGIDPAAGFAYLKAMRLTILSLLCLGLVACAHQQRRVFPYNASYDLSAAQYAALVHKANAGDASAAARLSLYYSLFAGDEKGEMYWLHRAARLGDVPSQYNLGMALIQKGELCEAKNWLVRAARAGDPDARRVLAKKLAVVGECSSAKDAAH